MNKQNNPENLGSDLEIPSALLADLSALYDRPVAIPPEIDEKVRKAGWRHFSQRRRRRMLSIRWLAPLAAAAVVAVMLLSVSREGSKPALTLSSTKMRRASQNLSRDFDGDGRFDIVDVLALAQDLEQGMPIDMRWDANGDGIINGEDVDQLGQNAVTLY